MSLTEYYVYHHVHDGKVFYVGVGKQERAFTARSRNRNWKDFVQNIPDNLFIIKIVKRFSNKRDALDFELQEIKRLTPKTNIKDNVDVRSVTVETRVTPTLYKKVLRVASKNRWSVSDTVEEALTRITSDHESK